MGHWVAFSMKFKHSCLEEESHKAEEPHDLIRLVTLPRIQYCINFKRLLGDMRLSSSVAWMLHRNSNELPVVSHLC